MNEEYICDDREKEMCEEVKKMTKEEREKEFQKRFGSFLKDGEEKEQNEVYNNDGSSIIDTQK